MRHFKFDQLTAGLVPAREPVTFVRAPTGLDAMALGDLARLVAAQTEAPISLIHVARDEQRLTAISQGLDFFAPKIEQILLPAWDCLPYDRVGPNAVVASQRLKALARIAQLGEGGTRPTAPVVVITTVACVLQRVAPRATILERSLVAGVGELVDMEAVQRFLDANGYQRAGMVVEPGEYAVRGGILDIFAAGATAPVRLDFFGKSLETVREFDPESQRTTRQLRKIALIPVSEVNLDEAAIARFRQGYIAAFGAVTDTDPLYASISAGRRYRGMEHWLPLFHENLCSVFDLVGAAQVSFDYQVEAAASERLDQIGDHFSNRDAARGEASFGAPPYKALPADQLYLSAREWGAITSDPVLRFTPFEPLEGAGKVVDLDGRQGREFAAERASEAGAVIDAAVAHIDAEREVGRRVLVVAASTGARDRLKVLLGDHGLATTAQIDHFADLDGLEDGVAGFAAYGLDRGFSTATLSVLSEQDILGERLARRRPRRADEFLTEVTALSPGDLVVHVDHGIARFAGLKTVDAAGAPHDCLELHYHGSDKLYLPVENIEMLSRFGSDEATVQLDRLGGAGWQARKAKAKQRIAEIAEGLIKIAAARALRTATRMVPDDGLFDEFRARFAFDETEDQAGAIDAVLDDLASGRAMDRLVCGDVGFGKTEVAIRAAFVAAASGYQTAIIGPTTLLARQHYNTFAERFAGFPMKIGRMSRLVGSAEMTATKAGLESGEIDIVIGTHALLGKSVKFKNLGLVVVDEEQHFGVVHKERLKELRHNVHVLTLTATPIPRTLQFALSGVRDLSLIASPPVDRLAVRTFITPFDPVVVREALLRELYRGGQSFFVCPRISDLNEVSRFLREQVPEVKFVTAHGRMAPGQLDDVMNAFYEGRYDVLLSTTIVESGLDIPSANTLVVFRADRFGLAQLYQLRGRVGRSKTRAYALFTVPANRILTQTAERRLKVLQSLDYLGAGFSLASHDLDIRGAGNLLGEEQSGHIREVGFELYQSMLEEAVAQMRGGEADDEDGRTGQWSPTINIGASVMIPERYVEDLHLRLGLYRRLAGLETRQELEGFAAELIDRFGPLPEEVENLMQVVGIKAHCRIAGIAKFDAGPKGAVFAFRDDSFANPVGLLQWIQEMGSLARVRPDHRVVVQRNWSDIEARLKGAEMLTREIARIAQGKN